MVSGSGTEDVYVPSLWYYKELEFLQDQFEDESGISTMTEQQESAQSSSHTSTSTQSALQPSASTNPVQSKRKKKEDVQRDLMILARDHFKKTENEFQVMARNWAFKLERMSAEQRRLAEKFINEILFEGEEGNLHRHSVIVNPSAIARSEYSILPTPSPTTQTPSPNPQVPSPIPHIESAISASSNQIEQAFLTSDQALIIHISDTQTNENSQTEADTAANFIKFFY